MFEIKIYNYDDRYTFLYEMMAKKPLYTLQFNQPKDEAEFNTLISKLDYEGYLYELLKNNEPYSDGIFTADSLYDDLFIADNYFNIN